MLNVETDGAGDSIIASSVTLQCIYVFIAIREICITTYDCVKGKIIDYKLRYIRYAAICCFDGCLILGFVIWTTVAYTMEEKVAESASFYSMTLANIVVGYTYYALICCAPGPCLQLLNGNNVERWIQNALVEDFGQPVEDNVVEIREMG